MQSFHVSLKRQIVVASITIMSAFAIAYSGAIPIAWAEESNATLQSSGTKSLESSGSADNSSKQSELQPFNALGSKLGELVIALEKQMDTPTLLPAETVVSHDCVNRYGEEAFFTVRSIPDSVFKRMEGVTFPADCPVTRDELRYVRLLHVDSQGNVKVGEMVVNQAIADDICEIFRELYHASYPIERVRLACDYGGDDEMSMEANNTSAFNCRPIEGTGAQSRHSFGMAIDVNPLYNPYVSSWNGLVLPVTGDAYVDRNNATPYTLFEGDLCWQLFTEHGFTWGGSWYDPKDYQHFEK